MEARAPRPNLEPPLLVARLWVTSDEDELLDETELTSRGFAIYTTPKLSVLYSKRHNLALKHSAL